MVWKKPGATHKARFMAFGLLVLKIFTFSEQQVVKDHCLSDVVVVEEEDKKAKNNNKPEKKKTSLSLQPGTGGEGGEVLCLHMCALSYYIPTLGL